MARGNDFQEIVGAIFALFVLFLFGAAIIKPLGDPVGLTGIFSLIFIVGGVAIGVALIRMIIKLLDNLFR